MTINQIFSKFPKVFKEKIDNIKYLNIKSWSFLFYSFLIFLMFLTLVITFDYIKGKKQKEIENFNTVVKSKEFLNLGDYFISKINSPYEEVNYIIENNDSVEKILKKWKIKSDDIKNITNKLKQKKLTNIYAGRQLSLVLKKLEDGSNTVVNIQYPINNTLSIEIRKTQDTFIVKEIL